MGELLSSLCVGTTSGCTQRAHHQHVWWLSGTGRRRWRPVRQSVPGTCSVVIGQRTCRGPFDQGRRHVHLPSHIIVSHPNQAAPSITVPRHPLAFPLPHSHQLETDTWAQIDDCITSVASDFLMRTWRTRCFILVGLFGISPPSCGISLCLHPLPPHRPLRFASVHTTTLSDREELPVPRAWPMRHLCRA